MRSVDAHGIPYSMDAIYMESMNCKVLIQNTAGSLIRQRVCGEGDHVSFGDAQKKAATLFRDLGPIPTGSDFPNTTNP